jgi:DNA-binding XRE family transcriptional regulator
MTDNLITRTGKALFGDNWQAQMSREIGVHKQTVQDWRQGKQNPRPGVYVDLMRIAVERQAELDDIVEELKRLGRGGVIDGSTSDSR